MYIYNWVLRGRGWWAWRPWIHSFLSFWQYNWINSVVRCTQNVNHLPHCWPVLRCIWAASQTYLQKFNRLIFNRGLAGHTSFQKLRSDSSEWFAITNGLHHPLSKCGHSVQKHLTYWASTTHHFQEEDSIAVYINLWGDSRTSCILWNRQDKQHMQDWTSVIRTEIRLTK